MTLKIVSIHEEGAADKEYVLLEATSDCDLVYYALADTTYTSTDKISNKLRHFFWFPSTAVKKGEQVILRSRAGTNDSYVTNSGVKRHRFFWGLKSAVWNNDRDAAVLFSLRTWQTTRA